MLVDLDQIEVLDAIERLGSFSAAAKELHRATSAVSYAIKTLENALEVEVYDRSGHKAELTDAGKLILKRGRVLLEEARQIERFALQMKQDWEPRLSVVMDGVLPMMPVIHALNRFTRRDLPTTVDLRVAYLSTVRQRFDEEEFDLMLTVDQTSDSKLTVRPMPTLDMVLLAHREHPLACVNEPLRREDFSEHVELLVSPAAGTRMSHIQKMYLGGAHVFELSDFHSKKDALLGAVGFGWMPVHLVTKEIKSGELVIVNYEEGAKYSFTPSLVFRRSSPLGRGAQLFAEFIEEELDKHEKQ